MNFNLDHKPNSSFCYAFPFFFDFLPLTLCCCGPGAGGGGISAPSGPPSGAETTGPLGRGDDPLRDEEQDDDEDVENADENEDPEQNVGDRSIGSSSADWPGAPAVVDVGISTSDEEAEELPLLTEA